MTKGYINERFKEYVQAIEEAGIKEAPTAVRARKTPKPRVKKSKQADIYKLPQNLNIYPSYQRVRKLKILKREN